MAEDEKHPPRLIIEYIPKTLSPEDLDEETIPIVLTHISSALSYLHANGITHRDVKPDNILIQYGGPWVAKLADFGTAKHHTREHIDTFTGTPIYMAPEFFDRPLRYTNKVDTFSLGLVAVQCLTKWDARSDEAWASGPLDRREHERWMRNVIIPYVADALPEFQPWLAGLLRKRPEKRWSARKSLRWLWQTGHGLEREGSHFKEAIGGLSPSEETHAQAHPFTEQTATKGKKRPASVLSKNNSGPNLQGKSASPQGSSFVIPSSPYSVPTPHDEEETYDESDESADENDAGLEDDWRERDNEFEDSA